MMKALAPTLHLRRVSTTTRRRLACVAVLACFLVILLRTAWVQDDAYITFRTVHNLCTGNGLTWNPAERVQTNLHPLWAFLLAVPYSVFGEIYYSALAVSAIASLLAVYFLLSSAMDGVPQMLFAATALLLSRTFVDYSTGGLENPVAHLVLVLFASRAVWESRSPHGLCLLPLLGSLLVLTRLDAALLVAPPLLHSLVRRGWSRSTVKSCCIGFLPLFAWLLFATFYFGSPLPSPAAAKVTSLDIPRVDLLRQGLRYFGDSLRQDPITLATIAVAGVVTLRTRSPVLLSLLASVALYLGYTAWVGGCFMSGRFLAAPLLLSVFLITRSTRSSPLLWSGGSLLGLALMSLVGLPTIVSGQDYDRPGIPPNGITDCRGFYFQSTGLWSSGRDRWEPLGRVPEARPDARTLFVMSSVGHAGFTAGPGLHIVDRMALCDPLLSRLPGRDRVPWRIAHVARHLPNGYLATLRLGENRISDASIAEYYDHLRLITRGPLFDSERLRAVCRHLFGSYDRLLDTYVSAVYRAEARFERSYGSFQTSVTPGTPWYSPDVLQIDGPLIVAFDARNHGERIEIGVDANDSYIVGILREGEVLVSLPTVASSRLQEAGLECRTVSVPPGIALQGYDRIGIVPTEGDGIYAVGFVRVTHE